MSDSASEISEATYYMPPRYYTEFKKSLAEIERFVCPIAAKSGLKIHRIDTMYDFEQSDVAIGFKISASFASGQDRASASGRLLPLTGLLSAVIHEARQSLVNREKTLEARERKIEELSSYGEYGLMNENPQSPKPLIATDPGTTSGSETDTASTADQPVELFDIERGRLRVANQWVILDSQVAEEFRSFFRSAQIAANANGVLDLDQTGVFLEVIEKAANKAGKLLTDPFASERQ